MLGFAICPGMMESGMNGSDENWTAIVGLLVAMAILLAFVFWINVAHHGA